MKSTDLLHDVWIGKSDGKVALAHWGKCSICLMLKAPSLCAGKSDGDCIDALAVFDIQLHVLQSLQH